MGPTGNDIRVLQIHVSRRCNLQCLHCYSSSGPAERDQVPVGLFRQAIKDAAAEGYNVVGFSGGEPLMYKPLRELLLHARNCGMVTTVTTNGMLLDARRVELLQGAAQLVAISLDGTPESHNRMRGSALAFPKMARRLPFLRASGIPFGFIFTLTQHNLHEVEWVTRFALVQGAGLLQIHPLELAGRAAKRLAESSPDDTELSYAVLAVARAQEIAGDQLRVQLDVAGRDAMKEAPERVFAADAWPSADSPLSEVLSPLIIEADGTVVPIKYSFGHRPRSDSYAEMCTTKLPRPCSRQWSTGTGCSRTVRRVFRRRDYVGCPNDLIGNPALPHSRRGTRKMALPKFEELLGNQNLAEREGFEPPLGCPKPDFESSAFDHSAISPEPRIITSSRRCLGRNFATPRLVRRAKSGALRTHHPVTKYLALVTKDLIEAWCLVSSTG